MSMDRFLSNLEIQYPFLHYFDILGHFRRFRHFLIFRLWIFLSPTLIIFWITPMSMDRFLSNLKILYLLLHYFDIFTSFHTLKFCRDLENISTLWKYSKSRWCRVSASLDLPAIPAVLTWSQTTAAAASSTSTEFVHEVCLFQGNCLLCLYRPSLPSWHGHWRQLPLLRQRPPNLYTRFGLRKFFNYY